MFCNETLSFQRIEIEHYKSQPYLSYMCQWQPLCNICATICFVVAIEKFHLSVSLIFPEYFVNPINFAVYVKKLT